MAINILSNSGKVEYNIKSLVADQFGDLPLEGIAVGSVAYVVADEQNYMFNSLGQWVAVSLGSGSGGGKAGKVEIVPLSDGEYDPETGKPTILDAQEGVIYLVPNTEPGSSDLYVEWISVGGNWEKFGSAAIDLSGYLPVQNPVAEGSFSIGRKAETTIGNNSIAIGYDVTASERRSFAQGDSTTASALGSHAEGNATTAKGIYSHAEGDKTLAFGNYSHSEGQQTESRGFCSHAEGQNTLADGDGAHAEGLYTVAHGRQHAEGQYNIYENLYNSPLHVVGNGKASGRSNAYELSEKGDGWFSGDVYVGSTSGTHRDEGAVKLAKINEVVSPNNPTFTGSISIGRVANSTIGTGSVAEGSSVTASGQYSHAEGGGTIASSTGSHAEGSGTTASGNSSHAEGGGTIASGELAHAEGGGTRAKGLYSHAEGGTTTASGASSHAEGQNTTAAGAMSHVEGNFTTAAGEAQHVQGKYNIEDTEGIYADIIGNGTFNIHSNAYTLDWNGNAWFANDVYVGSTSGTNKDEGSVKLAKITDLDVKQNSTDTTLTTKDKTIVGSINELNDNIKTIPVFPYDNLGSIVEGYVFYNKHKEFDGLPTSYIDTNIAIFSEENFDKDFEFEMEATHISNYSDYGYLNPSIFSVNTKQKDSSLVPSLACDGVYWGTGILFNINNGVSPVSYRLRDIDYNSTYKFNVKRVNNIITYTVYQNGNSIYSTNVSFEGVTDRSDSNLFIAALHDTVDSAPAKTCPMAMNYAKFKWL